MICRHADTHTFAYPCVYIYIYTYTHVYRYTHTEEGMNGRTGVAPGRDQHITICATRAPKAVLSLEIQIAQSRSSLCKFGPKVGITCVCIYIYTYTCRSRVWASCTTRRLLPLPARAAVKASRRCLSWSPAAESGSLLIFCKDQSGSYVMYIMNT